MNKQITLPKNWNPECNETVNNWFNKINREAQISRFGNLKQIEYEM